MENGEWNGVGLGLDTCPLKDKTTAKTEKMRKKPKSREEKPQIGGRGRTAMRQAPRAVVATTACPWWLLPGPFSRFPERRVLVHVWSMWFALDYLYWACWASFC